MVKQVTVRMTRTGGLLIGLFMAATAPVMAQECGSQEPVGWTGISGLTCTDCVLAYPGRGQASLFYTEPRISVVNGGSPASGVLRPGDVLVSVDNQLITTRAGAMRLFNLKPGASVTLGVRRNGGVVMHRLANLPAICPSDPRVLGSRARQGGPVTGSLRSGQPTPSRGSAMSIPSTTTRSFRIPAPQALPQVTFGFSVQCSTCARIDVAEGTLFWVFPDPPEIYSVEDGSQADRLGIRRGDVIAQIDNVDITTDAGGRKFGQVKPESHVQFTFRRGSRTFTRSLVAEVRPTVVGRATLMPARAVSTEAAARQTQALVEQVQSQQALRASLVERLLEQKQDAKLDAVAVQFLRMEQDQARKLEALRVEVARTNTRICLPVSATLPAGFAIEPHPPLRIDTRDNAFRYAGKLGETDVDVRSSAGVVVSETGDEIIIKTSDSTIRLKKASSR